METELKTGTTTVGIVCKEGIVLAADKRATAGSLIVDKDAKKVNKITNNFAVTIAGNVSDAQLLIKLLKAEIRLKKYTTERDPNSREAANLLAGMVYSNIRKMSMMPGIAHFLFAGNDKYGQFLFDIFPDGSLTPIKDYVSSGSGSVMAYGVLESQYKQGIPIDAGVTLAVRCVNAAMQRDSASGNGIKVITITRNGVQEVFEQDLNQRLQQK